MHDIGKIGIPDRILLKPGPLDADEWAIMKRHPAIGAELLSGGSSELMQMAETSPTVTTRSATARGYPRGLEGTADSPRRRGSSPSATYSTRSCRSARTRRRGPWTRRWRSWTSARAPTSTRSSSRSSTRSCDEVLQIHARYADDHESATHVIRASVRAEGGTGGREVGSVDATVLPRSIRTIGRKEAKTRIARYNGGTRMSSEPKKAGATNSMQ